MQINGILFNSDLNDILTELKNQLVINQIPLLDKIKDSGDDIMVCCPYHKNGQERKPSAGIRKTDGLFHCFTCGETHSLQEVISHCFGNEEIGGMWGWNWLLKNFVSVNVEERKDVVLDYNRNSNMPTSRPGIVNYITEEELDSYRYTHPYMYQRKLTDDIIELFDIGYDKNTDCITFPVRDVEGNALFVARRSVKTKFFNYPQGVEKPVYGLYEYYRAYRSVHDYIYGGGRCNGKTYALHRLTEIIICESMLDALTCWVYGRYAVALNGLGNELQFKQLRELPCRKLILATDNDEAGMRARSRIKRNVKNKIVTEYLLPEGKKDINELSLEEFNNLEEVF